MTEEETETLDVDRAFSGLELPGDLETFEGRVKSERVDLAHSDLIDLRKGLGKPTPGVRYESRKFDLERCERRQDHHRGGGRLFPEAD